MAPTRWANVSATSADPERGWVRREAAGFS